MDSFASIPAEIERRVAHGERVALIMIDGLGAELLARYEDHPFARRLALTALRSQFPATTTAHVTTIHYGLPVEQHGLYEWNILEPSLGELICPLMFEVAGGRRQDGLAGRLDPGLLAPGPTLYETLESRSLVVQPYYIGGSQYTLMATRGAERAVFAYRWRILRGGCSSAPLPDWSAWFSSWRSAGRCSALCGAAFRRSRRISGRSIAASSRRRSRHRRRASSAA